MIIKPFAHIITLKIKSTIIDNLIIIMTKSTMTEKCIRKASLGNRKMHWKDKEKHIEKPSLENRKMHWKDKHLGNRIQIINYYIFTFTMEINE